MPWILLTLALVENFLLPLLVQLHRIHSFPHCSLCGGFARTVEEATDHWVKRLNEMSRDLKKGGISPAEWQDQLAALYNYISPEEITAFIDFDRLVKGFQYPDLGVNTKGISFPKLQGVPKDVAFAKKTLWHEKGSRNYSARTSQHGLLPLCVAGRSSCSALRQGRRRSNPYGNCANN